MSWTPPTTLTLTTAALARAIVPGMLVSHLTGSENVASSLNSGCMAVGATLTCRYFINGWVESKLTCRIEKLLHTERGKYTSK